MTPAEARAYTQSLAAKAAVDSAAADLTSEAAARGLRGLSGGVQALNIRAGKGLSGPRARFHAKKRSEGLSWRPVGIIEVTNATGTDQLVWASSGTTTATTGGIKLASAIESGRLTIQNDGGSCTKIDNIKPDGQVLFTGAAPMPSAHVLIGKGTNVIDPLDQDTGLPIGNVKNTFDVQVFLANGDSAVIGINGYVEISLVDVDTNDIDNPTDKA